jgi:hypothetical protein
VSASGAARRKAVKLLVVDATKASTRVLQYVGRVTAGFVGPELLLAYISPQPPPELLETGGAEAPEREERLGSNLRSKRRGWMAVADRKNWRLLRAAEATLRGAGVAWPRISAYVSSLLDARKAVDEVLLPLSDALGNVREQAAHEHRHAKESNDDAGRQHDHGHTESQSDHHHREAHDDRSDVPQCAFGGPDPGPMPPHVGGRDGFGRLDRAALGNVHIQNNSTRHHTTQVFTTTQDGRRAIRPVLQILLFRRAFAVATMCSGVKPNSRMTTAPGADAPNLLTPMIAPSDPT